MVSLGHIFPPRSQQIQTVLARRIKVQSGESDGFELDREWQAARVWR